MTTEELNKITKELDKVYVRKENCDTRHNETKDLIAKLDKSLTQCTTQLKWITALLSGTLATILGAVITKIFDVI